MKKIFLFTVVSFFVGKYCDGQNLVPNPSFEDIVVCPTQEGEVHNCLSWSSFGQTSDYFNVCTSSIYIDVPINEFGEQNPSSGQAYCGLIAYVRYISDWREYIGTQLDSPLTPGLKYFFSFKTSLSDSSKYAVNNLGIRFSTFPNDELINPIYPNNIGAFQFANIVSDKNNWTVFSGSFVADSSYQYVAIGNFLLDSLSDTLNIQGNPDQFYEAYYYIDDVCVTTDSLGCDFSNYGHDGIKNISSQNNFNHYPNPATNQLTVESVGSQQYAVGRIEISNSLGVTVYAESINLKSKIINLKYFNSGIYFIKLYFGDGSMEVKKFVKE